ncbi:ankyrin repeat domain-containing protein [Actinoplanes sp. NPDC051851]|uniref:ankyrin repeat domain-containing protein n=1 Tax=Actinoplanes sp. NPDC051851 TaxID=3154753 RepID=UPI00343E48C2
MNHLFDLARRGGAAELAGNVTAGTPVDLATEKGDTLLILAAYHNHTRTVTTLLGLGADPDRINAQGRTALAAAVFRQNQEAVEALLEAGADPRRGQPSAVETAEFFALPEMTALLSGGNALSEGDAADGGVPGRLSPPT